MILITLNFQKNKKERKLETLLKASVQSPKYKIALVTLETRPSNMLNLHNKNIQKYADKHGYTYIYLNDYKNNLKLPIYWKKLQLLKEIMENTNYDYIVWLDSDTIIIEDDIRLESIIDKAKTKSIFIGHDKYSIFGLNLNAGFFILKNDNKTLRFIEECINTYLNREKCKNEKGEYVLNGEWSKDCYEQGVMNELLFKDYKKDLKVLKPYVVTNNSIPEYKCFILHLFNGPFKYRTDYREKIFKNIIKNKDQDQDKIKKSVYSLILM